MTTRVEALRDKHGSFADHLRSDWTGDRSNLTVAEVEELLCIAEKVRPEEASAPVPEPPFKRGDWVTSLPYVSPFRTVRIAFTTMEAWGGGWKFHPTDSLEWFVFSAFRKATDAEVRAVTHFTPRVGMILKRKSDIDYKAVWLFTHCEPSRFLATRIDDERPGHQDWWTYGNLTQFAHADWTILPSYEVKGVTL